ncbi:MAG TPA: efflux RND transporter periplasmic adaptor subunit [Opitutaceae bacterium]|jgi:HlyD family secretion protein
MTAPLTPSNLAAAPASTRPRKKSKLLWWLIGGGLVVVVVLCVVAAKMSGGKDVIGVTVDKATTKTIVQIVTATGKVQSEVEVKISPEVYGEIISLPYREGAAVKKGALIVKIKPDLYQAQVDQQTAAVAVAHSNAQNSEVQLEKATADLQKYQDLYDRKLVSDFDYVTYKTAFDAAKAGRAAALAQVDEAEGLLKQAKDSLSKTSIYSPMDGTVSSRSSEVGERVQASTEFSGTEIMRVADLSKMEVRVNVNENDIVNVKVGDTVKISIDAYPDRKFSGKVWEIGASAANSGASGQATATTDQVTNFVVRIRIADKDVLLRPGMSATADIQTQTASNVTAIPIQSVTVRDVSGKTADELQKKDASDQKEKSGNDMDEAAQKALAARDREKLIKVVFIKQGDKVHMQRVETGIADNDSIEVTSGVKPGDDVVSGPYAAISRKLKDGSKVRIEKPKPETTDSK